MATTITKKEGFFQHIARFFREVWIELKKTAWPSYEEVKKSTVVVLVAIGIITAWIGGLDFFLGWVTSLIGW